MPTGKYDRQRGAVKRTFLVATEAVVKPARMSRPSPFRYFETSPEIIRLTMMMYTRFPLSLRNVEDHLHERGLGAVRGTFLAAKKAAAYPARMSKLSPFRYLKTSPEVICLATMMYIRYPLSLRNVEGLLNERCPSSNDLEHASCFQSGGPGRIGFKLCCLFLMFKAAVLNGLLGDAPPFGQKGFAAPEVGVGTG